MAKSRGGSERCRKKEKRKIDNGKRVAVANLGSEGSQVESLCVAEGEGSRVVFQGKIASRVALLQEPAVSAQVAVVGCVDGVKTRVVPELEREERGGTPRDVGIDLDLIPGIAQMGETASTH